LNTLMHPPGPRLGFSGGGQKIASEPLTSVVGLRKRSRCKYQTG
jgi:hypothetical protein